MVVVGPDSARPHGDGASGETTPGDVVFLQSQQALLEQTAAGAPLAEVLAGIVRLVESRSSEMVCSILLLDRTAQVVRHGAAPSLPETFTRAIDGAAIGPEAGSCGAAAYRGEVVEVDDIATHPYWRDWRELALKHDLRACWSTPILSAERDVLGTFAMYYREPRGPRPDERRWVAAATHLAGIAIQAERARQIESALRRSEAELRAIFEHAVIGMALIGLDGRYLRVNPALCRILGYDADELVAIGPVRITDPQDLQRNAQLAFELMTGVRASFQLEKRYVRKDGASVWARLSASLAHDEATAEPLFVVAMVEDISAQKRLEGEVLRSQRLDGLSRMANGIAHDFNNVLTAIQGSVSSARDELPAEHPALEAVAEIERAASRATELVRRILAFSPDAEPQRALQPLAPIVREALRLLGAKLPATVTVREALDQDAWVLADATQLQQIVLNLAGNAIQAMPQGGVLGVRVAVVEVSEGDAGALVGPGSWARLTIEDTGIGIADDHLDEVFEPFFTTRAPGQGAGLGLAIVRQIAEAHHGVVHVRSELAHGSAFEVWLPAARPPARGVGEVAIAVEPATHASGVPVDPGTLPVLVVDDEPLIGRLAKRELERVGFRAEVHDDPERALASFTASPDGFSAIVTDASMPRLSGFELARAVRALRPGIPIVVISGGLWNRESLEEIGVSELLLKPDALRELAVTVRRLLAG